MLVPAEYAEHCKQTLPQPEDVKRVNEIQDPKPKRVAPTGAME